MFKTYFLLVCMTAISVAGRAQTSAYEQGDKLLNAGFSLGYYGYGYFGNRSGFSLPLNASLEYGITDQISIGPYMGYARWSWKYNDGFGENKYSWTFVAAGARGSFHYTEILNELLDSDVNTQKWDFYASLFLGLEFRSYNDDLGLDYYGNDTVVRLGPNLGVRYLFKPNIGIYFEGGRGTFGWLNFGLAARF